MMRKPLLAVLSVMLLVFSTVSAFAADPFPLEEQTVLVTVVGTNGTPVPGAVVELMAPGISSHAGARTDRLGQARLDAPDGFSFWLRVWAGGYSVIDQPYVPASDGRAVTIRLTSYFAAVAGIVTDDLGNPVIGARVTAWRDGAGRQASAVTDEQGNYVLEQLPATGTYTLQVEARGFQPLVQENLTLAPGVLSQQDLSMTLAEATITGEVTDTRTNLPAAGVTVDLILNGWGVVGRTHTDNLGSFTLGAPGLADGAYQLRLWAPNYEVLTTAAFTAAPGSWTDFSGANQIGISPLYAELSGAVLTDSGSPIARSKVELQRSGLGTIETATTDDQGFFSFAKLPAGTYRVRALPQDGYMHGATEWVTVNGGDSARADVTAGTADLANWGSSAIVGTVLDHQGNPLSGANVVAYRGPDTYRTVTDAQGRYRLAVFANIEDDVDPETSDGYHVTTEKDGYLGSDQQDTGDGTPSPAIVDVRAKSTARADFTLQPARATIAGKVLDERGRPVKDVEVVLLQEGSTAGAAKVKTDASGSYSFPNLAVAKQARFLPTVKNPGFFEGSLAPDGTLTAPFSLSPGTTTTRTLTVRPSMATIQGTVREGTDRVAKGAIVTAIRPADGQQWTATVTARGTYALSVPNGPASQYLVQVKMKNSASSTAAGAVAFNGNRGALANMTALTPGAITGTVYNAEGMPEPGAKVLLWAEGENEAKAVAVSNDAGQYEFKGLAPGRRYAVTAWDGLVTSSSLAPGEPILTPLNVLNSGETIWADVLAPVPAQ